MDAFPWDERVGGGSDPGAGNHPKTRNYTQAGSVKTCHNNPADYKCSGQEDLDDQFRNP
jgi:hypothetical protein